MDSKCFVPDSEHLDQNDNIPFVMKKHRIKQKTGDLHLPIQMVHDIIRYYRFFILSKHLIIQQKHIPIQTDYNIIHQA